MMTTRWIACAAILLCACPTPPTPCIEDRGEAPPFDAVLQIVDEAGAPVASAAATFGTTSVPAAGDGTVALHALDQPIVALVGAPGYFTEPVPLGPGAMGTTQTIKLWARTGRRFVMHSAGDVMFGRRYETPTSGDPLIPRDNAQAGAEAVVDSVSPMFSIADVRTVNLETVVSDRSADAAYPGKRFILRSRPGTLAGLAKLGVDVASQANNHARDYLDQGIGDTVASLVAANLPVVGVSSGPDAPAAPGYVVANGVSVGVLAFTTVDGSTVNDAYPQNYSPPSMTPSADSWLYEERRWGFIGEMTTIPSQLRRIGTVWSLFSGLESMLGADLAPFWSSIATVYPEMQDWVARRGHGGAAKWVDADSVAAVQAARAKADVVVVQLHAGYQFAEAGSDTVRRIARTAIDAGADIVIAHHPHVLQGFELYKGHVIAYSMGNFIFDQDFLSTFASVFLRTIWDGNRLLEARLVPVEIVGYRPVPVVDAAARQTLFRAWERSVLGGAAAKDDVGVHVFPIGLDPDTQAAQLVVEHDTGRIVGTQARPQPIHIDVDGGAVAPIGFDGLVHAQLGQPADATAVLVGKDVFGWGRFEDETADQQHGGDAHWNLDTCQEAAMAGSAASGRGFLRLVRNQAKSVLTRPVARVPLPRHLMWQHQGTTSVPLDPDPSYSLHLRARRTGASKALAKVEGYSFDDTNPTEDPDSVLLGVRKITLDVPDDGMWHELDLPIDLGDLDADGLTVNMVMLYFSLDFAHTTHDTTLDLDDVSFIEWRPAGGMTDRFGDFRWIKNLGKTPIGVDTVGLPATR